MNMLTDWIKRHQVAVNNRIVTFRWNFSIVRLMVFGTMLALLMVACSLPSPTPQPPRTEEITFQSGSFTVVGDLRLPGGRGPFPAVLFVHGSGPAERTGSGGYLPVMERMLQAGYATFAWDKPGTGESTGTIDQSRLIQQRAQIILDAIEVLKGRSDIDLRQIGLWGISQAGYVMPHALSMSDDIAFMICVSCPAMSGNDQMAFQVTALALCNGVPEGMTDQEASLLTELDRARTFETYEGYLHYREVLQALAEITSVSLEPYPVVSERAWQENTPVNRGTWNPIKAIERIRIPVLAIFGDRDRQMDPLQGTYAYRKALEQAENPKSRVELFANANHGIAVSMTGCPAEDRQRFERYVQSLGYSSVGEAQEALLKDPYKPGLLGDPPFEPKFLDTLEEWLRNLRR